MGIQYILDKGSRKFICPNCEKKRFVRYIDTENKDYLPLKYGRCDRESKCAYHLNPYQDGYAKNNTKENSKTTQITSKNKTYLKKRVAKGVSASIPFDIMKQTLSHYEGNTFIQNLLSNIPYPFFEKDIEKVIALYYLGTISKGYRAKAITFPFIDINNKIRAIQVKQFNKNNHTIGTDFLHSIIEKHFININQPLPEWLTAYKKNDKKVSCLFGEHLLKQYPTNTIALVEAPKTAIYGSLYWGSPDSPNNLLWLAVYNKSSFSLNKVMALKGRNVIVFPDLSKNGDTYNEWKAKADVFTQELPGTRFVLSNLLEESASKNDKENGLDLADYLIQLDWREFKGNNKGNQSKCDMEIAELEKINRRLKMHFN